VGKTLPQAGYNEPAPAPEQSTVCARWRGGRSPEPPRPMTRPSRPTTRLRASMTD